MTVPHSADSLVISAAAGAAVAFLVTLVLVPVTIRLARRLGVVDEPGARSSHTIDTPRLGGIAVGAGALAGLAVAAGFDSSHTRGADSAPRLALVLGAAALLVGCIGLADDLLRGIPVWVRLVAQLVVVAAVIAPWAMQHLADDPTTASVLVLAIGAAATAWVIGYVNAFNFMDGVDGMSGFVAIVVGLDLALVGGIDDCAPLVVAGLVVAGAAAGFLPLNLRPGTVFLGDGGSYFLGAWIATAVVIGIGLDTPPEAVLAVTVPYLADTSSTLIRRVTRRADWRESHHEHAYQRLIEQGWSHKSVSAAVAGVSALCAALGLISLVAGPPARVVAALAVVAVSTVYVVAPNRSARRPDALPSSLLADVHLEAEPSPSCSESP